MSDRIKLRLNYAKAKKRQAKSCAAKLGQGSIMPRLNSEKQNNHS